MKLDLPTPGAPEMPMTLLWLLRSMVVTIARARSLSSHLFDSVRVMARDKARRLPWINFCVNSS